MILKKGIGINKENWPIILENLEKNKDTFNWAYHAGWADGDGTFTNGSYGLKITEEKPVYNLADVFLTSVLLTTPEKRPGHGNPNNPRKLTKLSSKRAVYFIDKVMPFIIEKRKACYKILIKRNENKRYPYLMFDEKTFISYLTGFCEAEGTFYYTEKSSHFGFSIPNSNLKLLKYLSKWLNYLKIKHGFYKVNKEGNYEFNKKNAPGRMINRKNCYRIYISGKNALPLLEKMIPHMLIPKKLNNAKGIVAHFENKKLNS
jgi:hypothetical protein